MTIETPIRVLLPYISYELEHLSDNLSEAIKNLTSNGENKICLKLNSASGSIDTPRVNKYSQVTIGESFLCYVWAMCYYGSVYWDEAIVPELEIAPEKIKSHDFTLANDALSLRDWAKSLYYGYVEWPQEYPNPMKASNKYIMPVCEYFIFATSFIIEHEIAHVHLKHFEGKKSKEKEIEADNQSIIWHLGGKEGKTFNSKMGVLLGLCSMLSLNFQAEKCSEFHPSMFSRIQKYINSLDDDNKEKYYQVFALFIWDWDKQFNKNNDFDLNTTNAKDYVNGILEQMGLSTFK